MDVKEQGNGVEEIICDMINVFENVQQEIKIEMEKLKDEIRCKENDWTEERNKLKERIEKLEVRCEEYEIKNIEMKQLEGTEMMDSEKEDVECVWDRKTEIIKEWLDKLTKDVMQDEGKKNNMRDALISTTTPSTSQLQSTQLASISTDFVRNNNYTDLIGTPSTSGRYAQNQNSNVFQLNESNRPNTANSSTVSKERKNHTSSINFGDFKYFANKSNQSASSNSRNANIMCYCKKPAVQRAQKVGLNKSK